MDTDYYTALADCLLKDGLLLTALELYMEFAERGKCLQPLKRFFEDSNNFDQFTRKPLHESPVPSVTGSQQTLEDGASLFDLRYNSEDSIQVRINTYRKKSNATNDCIFISASPLEWLCKVKFVKKVLFQYRNFEMNLDQLVTKYCQRSHYKR